MSDDLSALVPTAKAMMQKIAAAEADKASEAMRKMKREEEEKKALIDRLSKPSGLSEDGSHFHLRNESHHTIFATSTELHPIDTGTFRAGDSVIVRARMENWLAPGRYFLSPTLAALGAGPGEALDVRMNLNEITVQGERRFDSAVDFPHTIDIERLP